VSQNVYIHGTEPPEQRRLACLNRLTNRAFIKFLRITPGIRVLEVGSGLGILAAEVADAADGVEVVGVERSQDQIASAVPSPRVHYVRGDAHHLDFADMSFDVVYARYLLEHVADPVRVLSEMRRVTRPAGRVAVLENDISPLRVDPPCPTFVTVWAAFAQYQRRLGGDALVGTRLFRMFRAAGFVRINLSLQPEVHWSGSPGFGAWVENLIGNLRGAKEGLVSSGLCHTDELEKAVAELAEIRGRDDASAHFAWNRAASLRDGHLTGGTGPHPTPH